MNMAKLVEKIAQLEEEESRVAAKIVRLEAVEPIPEAKIKSLKELLARLATLRQLAQKRLDGKAQRKAAREQGH
ncbi:MAG: hypothetical protein Kow00105_18150 [Phycisphaeraceae bacterium]